MRVYPSDDSVPKETRESLGRQCSEGITRVPRTTVFRRNHESPSDDSCPRLLSSRGYGHHCHIKSIARTGLLSTIGYLYGNCISTSGYLYVRDSLVIKAAAKAADAPHSKALRSNIAGCIDNSPRRRTSYDVAGNLFHGDYRRNRPSSPAY